MYDSNNNDTNTAVHYVVLKVFMEAPVCPLPIQDQHCPLQYSQQRVALDCHRAGKHLSLENGPALHKLMHRFHCISLPPTSFPEGLHTFSLLPYLLLFLHSGCQHLPVTTQSFLRRNIKCSTMSCWSCKLRNAPNEVVMFVLTFRLFET